MKHLHRWLTRAAVSYAFLYCLPAPLDAFPAIADQVWNATDAAWRPLVELAARVASLELPPLSGTTGSGDTLSDWLRVPVTLLLALVIGGLWSLDRRRTNDDAVVDFTRDYLRIVMLTTMLSYGVAKVQLQQMPGFSAYNLFDTYAESSPMGLAWRFMGFSPAYERFAGLAEMLGGLLLLSRRTTTLGGLIIAGVMTNVVMLNFCFDIPVKLYSSHLLLASLALTWPDLRRLARVLWSKSTVLPRDLSAKYARSGWRRGVVPVLLWLLVAAQLFAAFTPPAPDAQSAPLVAEGSWEVVSQTGTEWQRVYIATWGVQITVANQTSWFKATLEDQTLTVDSIPLQWQLDGGLLTSRARGARPTST